MKVFAFSLITNKCETDYGNHEAGKLKFIEVFGTFDLNLQHFSANHEEVMAMGLKRQDTMLKFVAQMVKKISDLA